MKAKDARNLIVTLIVLAIGVKLITWISANYISKVPGAGGLSSTVNSFLGLGDLSLYAIAIVVILLIPYYLSKRSKERQGVY